MKRSQLEEQPQKNSKNIQEEIGVCIDANPLSVNELWIGRKWKTKKYEAYEKEIAALLPARKTIQGKFRLQFVFRIKNANRCDLDNLIKPLVDIMQKKGYYTDDRNLVGLMAEKIKSNNNLIYIYLEEL